MQKFMIRYRILSVNRLKAKATKAEVFGALITGTTRVLRASKALKAKKTIAEGVKILISGV